MTTKSILIIDDEKGFIEALEDALIYEGYQVFCANTGTNALDILRTKRIDLVTVDIMMPPGKSLESTVDSHNTGIYLCHTIRKNYPQVYVICVSVVTDPEIIKTIRKLGVDFLKKGEVPLRTLLRRIKSKLTGFAYSTHPDFDRRRPR